MLHRQLQLKVTKITNSFLHPFILRGYKSQPGPLPLGDKQAQKEMENLIETKAKELETSELNVYEKNIIENEKINPETINKNLNLKFEEDKNLETGEIGGPKGMEPTRYGDWERKGRVFDF